MEDILTPEEKKYLRKLSLFMKSEGAKNAYLSTSYEGGIYDFDASDIEFLDTGKFDYIDFEITNEFREILKKCAEYIERNIDSYTLPEADFGELEVRLDVTNRILTISFLYTEYTQSEEISEEFDAEDDEVVNEIFNQLSEISNKNTMVLEYNGGGDSGYIESQFESGENVPANIEDFCYRVLENSHGGWEINEGSQGRFVFDKKNKIITLEHTYNEENNEKLNLFTSKF